MEIKKKKKTPEPRGVQGLRAAFLSLEGNERLFLPGRNDWVGRGALWAMPVYLLACVFQLLLCEREKGDLMENTNAVSI